MCQRSPRMSTRFLPVRTSTPSPSAHPVVCTPMLRWRHSPQANTWSWRNRSTSPWPPPTDHRSGGVFWKTVAVISQHRFDKSTEKVMAAVRSGNFGTITSAIASHAWWRGQSYYDSGDWRGTWAMDGGGAIMNQTVHTINLMVTMLGTPVEVFAYTACLAHERIEVEDTAVAVVKFSSGALGVIHGTTAAYPGLDASLRIFGSKGSAIISNDELTFFHENAGDAPEILMPDAANPPNQVTDEDKLTPGDQALGKGHQAQLADFADCDPHGWARPGGHRRGAYVAVGHPCAVRIRRQR